MLSSLGCRVWLTEKGQGDDLQQGGGSKQWESPHHLYVKIDIPCEKRQSICLILFILLICISMNRFYIFDQVSDTVNYTQRTVLPSFPLNNILRKDL